MALPGRTIYLFPKITTYVLQAFDGAKTNRTQDSLRYFASPFTSRRTPAQKETKPKPSKEQKKTQLKAGERNEQLKVVCLMTCRSFVRSVGSLAV